MSTTNLVHVATNAFDSVSGNTLFAPFDTYFVPGLILFSVLGLGPLVAARLVWIRHPLAPIGTLVVGVALLIWVLAPPVQGSTNAS